MFRKKCRSITFVCLLLLMTVTLNGCAIAPILSAIFGSLASSLFSSVGDLFTGGGSQKKASPPKTTTRVVAPPTVKKVTVPSSAAVIAPSEDVKSTPIKAVQPIRSEIP
jgi:hypothetical protein